MRLTRIIAILAGGLLTALAVTYHFTREPAPAIEIRWVDGMTWDERLAIEQRLRLVYPREQHEWTIVYDLVDIRQSNIRELVALRQIEETKHVDRRAFAFPADSPYGVGWMWWGDRQPVLRRQGVVPSFIVLCGLAFAYGLSAEWRRRGTEARRLTARLVRARRRARSSAQHQTDRR